jgi:hypothetical protein
MEWYNKKIRNPFLKRVLSFSELEIQLRDISKIANRNKVKGWYIRNILIPISFVFIPYIISLFIPVIKIPFREVFFNGSITLIGVSILFSMSSYLVRSKVTLDENISVASKKQKVFNELSNLRDKLLGYVNWIVGISFAIYFIQVVYNKFTYASKDIDTSKISEENIFGMLVILLFIISMYFGKVIFEISDDFIDEAMTYEAIYKSVEKQDEETKDLLKELEEKGI